MKKRLHWASVVCDPKYDIKFYISGTSVDWEVSLQVGSAGPSHAIPPGWYVEDPRDGLLLGNLPINGDIYVPKC